MRFSKIMKGCALQASAIIFFYITGESFGLNFYMIYTHRKQSIANKRSVVQYTQTDSNGMDWYSIGTPLVNCISLRRLRLFSVPFC